MQFKTNLGQLWVGGAKTLPNVADDFAFFSNRVDTVRDHGPEFESEVATVAMTNLGQEWNILATTLQEAMAKTATNLRHTGKALVKFAEEADDTDANAAAEIAQGSKELDSNILHIKPVYPNDKDHS